jgi:hypothetical protein
VMHDHDESTHIVIITGQNMIPFEDENGIDL